MLLRCVGPRARGEMRWDGRLIEESINQWSIICCISFCQSKGMDVIVRLRTPHEEKDKIR